MQKYFRVLIAILILMSVDSCHTTEKQLPEQLPEALIWERLFFKNDLEKFDFAVFSADGERFLVSDEYKYIRLWKKPFTSPERDLPVRDLSANDFDKVTAIQFFGNQDNIFLSTNSGVAQIWDKNLQNKIFECDKLGRSEHFGAISQDGRFIAIGGELYDRQKKSDVGKYCSHITQQALSFGQGSLLLTADYWNQRICVRNMFSGDIEYRRTPHPILSAGISPNEKYAVAVASNKGRGYLWNWPEKEPKTFVIDRHSSLDGFSPDSKWFVLSGSEFVQIFQTDPLERISRFAREGKHKTAVDIASNNLIAIGDSNGYVYIYDVSAGRMIGRQKVCEHAIGPLKLFAEKGYLWAAAHYTGDIEEGKCEIALYHIKGLEPYIKPKDPGKPKGENP